MHLNEEDLREFMDIWQAEFEEPISTEEAREHASAVLELYVLLTSPSSREDA